MAIKRMTAREYLATSRGRRWLSTHTRNVGQPLGFGWGVGDVIGIVDWMNKLIGGGKRPGITPGDLEKHREEMLRALREAQESIERGIGGVGSQIGDLKKEIGEVEDMLEEMRKAQEAGDKQRHQELTDKLDTLLLESRRNTEMLMQAIGGVTDMMAGMWGNMNAWFGEMLAQFNQIQQMLEGIAEQLTVVVNMLKDIMNGIEQVKHLIDWSTTISVVTESQNRIQFAINTAFDIHFYYNEEEEALDDESDPKYPQIDRTELDEWARKTSDLATGLPYYLFSLHQAIIGDTIMGKPLLMVYFTLMGAGQDTLSRDPRPARLFTQLAALQAQGTALLMKTRDCLHLPPIDYFTELEDRLKKQLVITTSMLPLLTISEMDDYSHGKQDTRRSLGSYIRALDNRSVVVMVPGAHQVICNVVTEKRLRVYFGKVNIETGTIDEPQWMEPKVKGTSEYLNSFPWGTDAMEGYASYIIDTRKFIVDPKYAIVGFRLWKGTTADKIHYCRIDPIVALYDAEKGTTTWDGNFGTIFLGTLPDAKSSDLFGGRNSKQTPGATAPQKIVSPLKRTRGVNMVARRDNERPWIGRISAPNENYCDDTWLPLQQEATKDATYTPYTVPSSELADT